MSKEFTIENEYLKLTVTTWGAQVKSVVRKCDGVEHIWQADKSVWGYHALVRIHAFDNLSANQNDGHGYNS